MSHAHVSLAAALVVATLASGASACIMRDTSNDPPVTWWSIKSPSPEPGFVRQQFYMNVGIFAPVNPLGTPCCLGFGYEGAVILGLVPMAASVVIWDPSAQAVVGQVPEFDPLTLNANTTAGLNDPTQYPAGGNYNWFGFGGLIPAFVPPAIPPNLRFAVCIVIDVPIALDPVLKARWGVLAGGVGDAQFNPIFENNEHAVGAPFGVRPLIPAPGSAVGLLAVGGLLASRRRRMPS